jgi:hypothetical protein
MSVVGERKAMIDCEHDLAITKQAEALNISRGSVYYLPGISSSREAPALPAWQ